MKKVFGYDELARVWVSQTQDEGRSPGERMYFTGDTVYSYGPHFPIATIFDAPNGEKVVLFTTRTHSNTTRTHCAAIESALSRSRYRVVYCAVIKPPVHETNLADFYAAMQQVADKHANARKPQLYKADILHQCRLAREYCEVMCLPVPAWALLPDNIEAGKPLITAMKITQEHARLYSA